MLSLVETNEQRRTVEEFCSTQECGEIKNDVDVHQEELPSKSVSFGFFSEVGLMSFANVIVSLN